MRMLILAGGFGTRLSTVSKGLPKPMVPIGDVPFLQFQLENWLKQGAESFCFLLHYSPDRIIDFVESLRNTLLLNCEVQYIVEPRPLGTGGAIAYAVDKLDMSGSCLVVNADTWIESGIRTLTLSQHPAMAVTKAEDISRYGEVVFDSTMRVTKFVEKQEQSKPGWINAGVYNFDAKLFRSWDGEPFSLEHKVLPQLVNENLLHAVALDTAFVDIGTPDDYNRFRQLVSSG